MLVLATLAVITHLYLLVVAVAIPQSSPDTQLYHLPRAALWKQQHAVAYVRDVPDERVDASPPVAEIQIAASMILSDGDRYTTLVQLAAVLAACLGIAGIARRLGLGLTEAAFGAVAFSTYTIVVLQTPTALNDLAVAGPLVACAYFAIRPARVDLVLAALALARRRRHEADDGNRPARAHRVRARGESPRDAGRLSASPESRGSLEAPSGTTSTSS